MQDHAGFGKNIGVYVNFHRPAELTPLITFHPCIPEIAKRYGQLDSQIERGRISASDAINDYAWVVKDGTLGMARLASAVPTQADDSELSIPFIITTREEDRDGDVVNPRGIQLHNFKHNPVCSFGHFQNPGHPLPVAKCKSPDGRITVFPEDNLARCVMYFDREDEFAVKVYKKYKSGYLNATSIAFCPIQAQRRDREAEKGLYDRAQHERSPMTPAGWLFESVDLTEIACVPVPANAGAIRDWMDQDKELTNVQRKGLAPYAAKSIGRSFSGWCPPGTVACPDGSCRVAKALPALPGEPEDFTDEPDEDDSEDKVPTWDAVVDGKAWRSVKAMTEADAKYIVQVEIDQVRRKEMPPDYTECQFRERFPKPKITVKGPYNVGSKRPPKSVSKAFQQFAPNIPVLITKNGMDYKFIGEPLAIEQQLPQERWNKSLGSAFDAMPELQMGEAEKVQAATTHRVAAKYLGCQIKDLHQSSVMVPSPRMGTFLSGLKRVLAEYRVVEVRNVGDHSEQPPVYETIQLNSKSRDNFLVHGTMFMESVAPRGKRANPRQMFKGLGVVGKGLKENIDEQKEEEFKRACKNEGIKVRITNRIPGIGKTEFECLSGGAEAAKFGRLAQQYKGSGPHNNYGGGIGDKRFVVKFRPEWGGLNVTVITQRADAQLNQSVTDRAWTWAKANNFLKGEAFALSGEFLPRTDESFDDVFLEPRNIRSVQRTLDLFNKKGLDFANRGVIMTGPPGTGKTLSGRIIRNQAKGTFIWVSSRDFHASGSVGGLSGAFEMAKELAPAIVFMEDVDNWLEGRTIDLLKSEMDGIARSKGVLTILTTNFPEQLPEALIDRPGRFHDVLNFDLPAEDARREMLRKWLPDVPQSSIESAVEKSAGYSGAHVYELAHFAKTLNEQDDMGPAEAVTEALAKVEQQRDLITKLQLSGSNYDPLRNSRRKRGDPVKYTKEAPAMVAKGLGKVGKSCDCDGGGCGRCSVAKGAFQPDPGEKPQDFVKRVHVTTARQAGQQGEGFYVSGNGARDVLAGPFPTQNAAIEAINSASRKSLKGFEGRGGSQSLLPTRPVEEIFERMTAQLNRDPQALALPEFSEWKAAVTEHYVNLRTADTRMNHRRALEQAYSALVSAAKRVGVNVPRMQMPPDGAKQLVKKGENVLVRDIRPGDQLPGKGVVRYVDEHEGGISLTFDDGAKYNYPATGRVVVSGRGKSLVRKGTYNVIAINRGGYEVLIRVDAATQEEAKTKVQGRSDVVRVNSVSQAGKSVKKDANSLKADAARILQGYLTTPSAGRFQQAWDRLREAGFDVDLRREPNEQNARALLWIAQNKSLVRKYRGPYRPVNRGAQWWVVDADGQDVAGPFRDAGSAKTEALTWDEEMGGPLRRRSMPKSYCRRKQLAESGGTSGGYTVPVSDVLDVPTAPENGVCVTCDGTGECQSCGGLGMTGNAPCELCGGTGECADCAEVLEGV